MSATTASTTTTAAVCRVSENSRHRGSLVCVGRPLVLRGRVSALSCASGSTVSSGSFVGAVLFCCHYCGPCGPRRTVRGHSLSVASGACGKA